MSDDAKGDAAKARFAALLGKAAAQSQPIEFWWRDDDAETASPALDRLLLTARRHALPLALAVIPKSATAALAGRLSQEPRVAVLQHGWQHKNHAAEGGRKFELGSERPTAEVLEELRRGCERLRLLFPEKFLPVLVPPWNRLADAVRDRRGEVGLVGLSTFGAAPADGAHVVNVHVDIFEWRPTRRPIARATAYDRLSDEITRRLQGSSEPVGIMTHHLVHEEKSWELLDELLGLIARHPAAKWPATDALFRLGEPAASHRASP